MIHLWNLKSGEKYVFIYAYLKNVQKETAIKVNMHLGHEKYS